VKDLGDRLPVGVFLFLCGFAVSLAFRAVRGLILSERLSDGDRLRVGRLAVLVFLRRRTSFGVLLLGRPGFFEEDLRFGCGELGTALFE
jgi:hypothetical protein